MYEFFIVLFLIRQLFIIYVTVSVFKVGPFYFRALKCNVCAC